MNLHYFLKEKISETFPGVENVEITAIRGGSINETYCICFSEKSIFCKINSATKFPHLFAKEKKGLTLLAEPGIIKTPSVIDCFLQDDKQVLFLEWIEEGNRNDYFWKTFGEQLARLHLQKAKSFGLDEDNYMGNVPLANTKHTDWCRFFATERLAPMINRCANRKLLDKSLLTGFERLEKRLENIFEPEHPSLLHGDLWSGNFMCNQLSEPVLIDPAVYYGHRSMDLGMTTLFGGFNKDFYEAYHYHYPFPANYKEQWAVCNLYPLLIHLYLFGNSYLPQIESTLHRFV